jgi:hypothetical protein
MPLGGDFSSRSRGFLQNFGDIVLCVPPLSLTYPQKVTKKIYDNSGGLWEKILE